MTVFRLAALAALVFVASCATAPKPKIQGAFATLEFNKGYTAYQGVGAGRASVQFYKYMDDPACPKVTPTSMTWTTPAMVSHASAAGRPILIEATSQLINSAGTAMRTRTCVQAVGFVPEAGHTYSITQRAEASGCTMEVVDKTTGQAPPTLRRMPAENACQMYLGKAG